MLFELNQHGRGELLAECRRLLRLALPILVAQAAQVGVGVVDTVMAGHASANDLAGVALGSNVFITLYITFLGVMTALQPILAQLYGAGKTTEIGEQGRQGLWFGLFLGVLGMLLLWALIVPMQRWLNMGTYVNGVFGQFVFFIALGMPAAMIHRAFYAFASSLNRPKPIMVVSLIALLLNIPLNYVFVYGKYGMPELGGAGCGLASAICFWFNAIVLGIYVFRQRYFAPFALFARFDWPRWRLQGSLLRLGIPIGMSFFLEVSLFTFISLLIARFGVTQVAAQQVVISITSLLYMLPQSVGIALAVCVGQAVGARKWQRARFVSGVGLSMGLLGACFTGVMLLLFRHFWVGLYTADQEVILLGGTLLIFAAVFQLSDATQTIASYALRGYKLTKIPMVIHAFSFWGLGLGFGCLFGLYFGMALYGFWLALVLALTGAAVALVWYLHRQSEKIALAHAERES
ncbi:MATE family efflux transporter [Snodgrassella alvi]|uniref:MATE family efflux transporter n=1 Tax=Snodgrassella alvi TaxID=1196083 RepID=UPI000C1E5276|nr:MATE family efflux transporter [Snodgrassella alvi]PIT15565.1 multidrug efflux MATE transporter NorM [Snodgrassella alvi]PIT18165.1 multidrug efflux MATE transporter NorM [Snodgrassella alvi]